MGVLCTQRASWAHCGPHAVERSVLYNSTTKHAASSRRSGMRFRIMSAGDQVAAADGAVEAAAVEDPERPYAGLPAEATGAGAPRDF